MVSARFAALLFLMACGSEPSAPVDVTLTAEQLLVRASLDVRGTRPTASEMQAVIDNPASVDDVIDGFVEDAGFLERVKSMFAPGFRTRIDFYPFGRDDRRGDVSEAIGEEPLDLLATLVANDRPYSDLVLADYTVVRRELLGVWPLEATDRAVSAPEGTVIAAYTDGRPHAGVLSSNAMWIRHPSTLENANRGRANALTRALLCENFLDRPIDFPTDLDLSDSETIRQAIREEPACTACHATLDPLASYLWGFMDSVAESPEALSTYEPTRERDWMRFTDRPPGYFGTPGSGLLDLGIQLASDERFVRCAVERVYEGMLGRDAAPIDDGAIAEHRDAFVTSGLDLKALVRSVLTDARYQGTPVPTAYGGRPEAVELKVITPDQLSQELEALTGYRMTFDERDALRLDSGLRSVAGGSDQGNATLPSTGLALVHRRLAEAAAVGLVDGVVTDGELSRFLPSFDRAPTGEQLAELVLVTSSQQIPVDGPEADALLALWEDSRALTDPPTAWKALLTALLSDPARLVY
ncbi:MAG: DUF1588 domain-containing protein [Myxococcota bacterium]